MLALVILIAEHAGNMDLRIKGQMLGGAPPRKDANDSARLAKTHAPFQTVRIPCG